MDGVEGFEPPNTSTKNWCLTAWRYPNLHKLSAYVDGIIAPNVSLVKRFLKKIVKFSLNEVVIGIIILILEYSEDFE